VFGTVKWPAAYCSRELEYFVAFSRLLNDGGIGLIARY
jgi:hypothetical protein